MRGAVPLATKRTTICQNEVGRGCEGGGGIWICRSCVLDINAYSSICAQIRYDQTISLEVWLSYFSNGNYFRAMPPIRSIKRGSSTPVTGDISPTHAQPSTWKVVSVLAGSAWFTYNLCSAAKQIWHWVQHKLELRNQKLAQKRLHRLGKRQTKVICSNRDLTVVVTKEMGSLWCNHQCSLLDIQNC